MQKPEIHLSGSGCEKCGFISKSQKRKYTTNKFIEKALHIHKNKYDYSKVCYKNYIDKVIIICPIHGEFKQSPSYHLIGRGCKKCGYMITSQKQRKTLDNFIEEAKCIHKNKYDYSKVNYKNNRDKIIIVCNIHGNFLQSPADHLRGYGCKKCAKVFMDQEYFIIQASKKHNGVYDYSKVKYVSAKKKIIIICYLHGEFLQTPSSHLRGRGCGKCSKTYMDREYFINKSNCIHNNTYDYSDVVYTKSIEQVKIKCGIHGIFLQTPHKHLCGQGCPKCSFANYSKKSIEWLNYISKKNNIFIQHAENSKEYIIKGSKYKADGYCEENNTIYEFYGSIWHGDPRICNPYDTNPINNIKYKKLYNKTIKREKYIKSCDYNLEIMWEYDWDKFKF